MKRKNINKKIVPYFEQEAEYTCGPATCRMALAYFDITKTEQELTNVLQNTLHKGTNPLNVIKLFSNQGFDVVVESDILAKNNIIRKLQSFLEDEYIIISLVNRLIYNTKTPLIDTKVKWENQYQSLHYIIVSSINENGVLINDPHKVVGVHRLQSDLFIDAWINLCIAVKKNN